MSLERYRLLAKHEVNDRSLSIAQHRMVPEGALFFLTKQSKVLFEHDGGWWEVSKSGYRQKLSRYQAEQKVATSYRQRKRKRKKTSEEMSSYFGKRFDPHQPRWPRGSGDKSGEWIDFGSPGSTDRVHRRALPRGSTPKGHAPRTWPRGKKEGLYHYGESVTYPRTDRFGLDSGFLNPQERKKLSRPQVSRGATNVIPILEGKQHYKDPGEAVYRRSMDRKTKISDQRLQDLYANPDLATREEIKLIGSATSSRELDGTSEIKVETKGGIKAWERSYVIGQLRSRLQPSTAGTGRKLDPEKREKINAKRVAVDKPSSKVMNTYRTQIAKDWGDGKSATCVFCGGKVSVFEISVEKGRPGQMGGKYSQKGNRWPACHTCNVQAGKQAQADPQTYFEDSLRRFKRLPASVRRKLKFVYEEFPELGRYPFKEN